MAFFKTDRSLLNSNFEGYKLRPLEQDQVVSSFPLSNFRPTQINVSGRTKTPLSFEEVRARITYNHLTVAYDGKSAVYVDEDWTLVKVVIGPDGQPSFNALCELPKTIQSSGEAEVVHREYPSVVSLPNGIWIVADGAGLLYVLKSNEDSRDNAHIYAVYQLATFESGSSTTSPFRIHSAVANNGTAVCILSCFQFIPQPERRTSSPFLLYSISINLDIKSDSIQPLNVTWRGCGDDIPVYTGFDVSRQAFFILGKGMYKSLDNPLLPSYEPTKDELAPIPRADETLPDAPLKPPPYSWTQSSDSVTIAFPLPSNIPKSSIHVTITAKTLSLLITHELPTSVDLPRYSLKELWDSVNPSSSFWTWDKEADKQFGLLTLHLDKQHEDRKWMHVFASVGKAASSEITNTTDVEVPETIDPSELYLIRESLEKYTSALQTGEDASGLGLGRGVPSLAEGEFDDAVDTDIGRRVWVSWLGVDGKVPPWSATQEGISSALLSSPIPSGEGESTNASVVMKNDIDGLLFELPPLSESASTPPMAWSHTSTFPALAFVLASKRDTRFTFHLSSRAVFAFESGTGFGGGNVYIYRKPVGKEEWAKQSILRVSGGGIGALLGVGMVKKEYNNHSSNGNKNNNALLCLCEGSLVVVKDVA